MHDPAVLVAATRDSRDESSADEPSKFARQAGRRYAYTHDEQPDYVPAPRRRRKRIPLILFLLTCLSTFWVGITDWQPMYELQNLFVAGPQGGIQLDLMSLRRLIVRNWSQGLIYMACVLAILLVHEMGHFIMTVIYRIPATAPIFLPFPFNPIGTLGAVIGMEGMQADRRQIFDIGIAGPLAGLVVALPLAIIGINQLDLTQPPSGQLAFECPLLFKWIISAMQIEGYESALETGVWLNQLNPFFAAAWVGFVVTGLNMIPVGQLDGGHITHAIFGKYAHWVAECIIVLAIAFMVFRGIPHLAVMVLLLLVMGTQHPPTRDDTVKLGPGRITLGLLSLTIPLLCFPPYIFHIEF
ncbi:MAG: site-2 protease family protein [Pirellulaceae bacterium]